MSIWIGRRRTDECPRKRVDVKPELEKIVYPGIAAAVVIFGVLSILSGIILCFAMWPGSPGSGYIWKSAAYTPSVTWLFSGFVTGLLLFAAAAALTYLHSTREYAKAIAYKLCAEAAETEEEPLY